MRNNEIFGQLGSNQTFPLLLVSFKVLFEFDLYFKNHYLTYFCLKLEFDLTKYETDNTINYIKNVYDKGLQCLCLTF